MVLSLAFVLAFIGAAVGLLIGIIIFSEVSDSISCPASGGGGGGGGTTFVTESYDNLGTLGTAGLATYAEFEVPANFEPAVDDGILNEAVLQTGVQSFDENGEIYLGSSSSTWDFLHKSGVGSDLVSINLWLRGDVDGSVNYPILTNYHAGVGNGFWFATEGTFTRYIITEDGTQRLSDFDAGGRPADDSQWHMLTITYDKSITTGNGNLVYCLDASCFAANPTDSDWTGAGVSASDVLTMGSDADHTVGGDTVVENTFELDDVAIWNGYTLTGTDITNLYNSGVGSSAGSISPSTLRGYWTFDDPTANQIEITATVLFDTTGATSDGTVYEDSSEWIGQRLATTGEQITAITINGMDRQTNVGTITGEIYTGATTDIDSSTLVGTSDTVFVGGIGFDPDFDFTVTFTPPVTVSDPNTYIALHASNNWDSSNGFLTSSTDIGGNEGVFLKHVSLTTAGFTTPVADMLMKVETTGGGGGPAETGSEECQQAKDTAWTVIGIIPVALFFALFAIFGAIGKPQ